MRTNLVTMLLGRSRPHPRGSSLSCWANFTVIAVAIQRLGPTITFLIRRGWALLAGSGGSGSKTARAKRRGRTSWCSYPTYAAPACHAGPISRWSRCWI